MGSGTCKNCVLWAQFGAPGTVGGSAQSAWGWHWTVGEIELSLVGVQPSQIPSSGVSPSIIGGVLIGGASQTEWLLHHFGSAGSLSVGPMRPTIHTRPVIE